MIHNPLKSKSVPQGILATMLTLARKHGLGTVLVLFCLSAFGTQFLIAESSKDPTTWWPDPSTGLMWAGEQTQNRMTWQEANDYCASLQLGGYSGWRLPTLQEMKPISDYQQGSEHYFMELKGRISAFSVWTSTLSGDQQAWVVRTGEVISIPSFERFIANGPDTNHLIGKLTTRWGGALCTRPMEAELLQVAKDAQVRGPVWDLVTLKANVPLNKARVAYQAGQFQESLTQSKNSLLIKPDLAYAYWGVGISYGGLGQWDLAITNLEAALKIDKNYGDAKDALKWAKQGQKAAKDGKSLKAQSPQWN